MDWNRCPLSSESAERSEIRREAVRPLPDIILAGDYAEIREQAIAFCYQRAAIPIFISADPAEREDSWEYLGDYWVESWTENHKEIAIHKQRAPANTHISRIMFLRRVSTPSRKTLSK